MQRYKSRRLAHQSTNPTNKRCICLASIRGASPFWMYPDSGTSRRWSLAKLTAHRLLLRAPGAARPGDCFGDTGNVGWSYTVIIFSLWGYDVPAVIPILISLAGDVESNPEPPKISCPVCSQCITNYKKIHGLCSMHLLQRLGPHYLHITY